MLKLYHGSTTDIDRIDLRKSRPNKDSAEVSISLSIVSRHGAWASSRHLPREVHLF